MNKENVKTIGFFFITLILLASLVWGCAKGTVLPPPPPSEDEEYEPRERPAPEARNLQVEEEEK